jgi:creatinine amidohydrolase
LESRVLWEENRWEEIEEKLQGGAPVILPVGCVEEHGPHLPVGTDLFQAYYVSIKVAERVGGLVLPPFHYGHSSSTRNFPGSVTISAETLRSLTRDVIGNVIRMGARLILVNTGHAGSTHMAAMKDTLRELAEESPEVKILFLTDYEIAGKMASDDDRFPDKDGHAGDVETSRMMEIKPDLVTGTPEASFPDFPRHRVLPNPERYFQSGLMGDPSAANPEKGRYINGGIIEYLVSLLESEME